MFFYRSYRSFLKSQNTRIVKLPPPQIYLLSVTQRKFFKKFLQGQTTLMSPWRRWYINSTRGRKLLRGQNFGGRALACALSWRPQLLDGTSGTQKTSCMSCRAVSLHFCQNLYPLISIQTLHVMFHESCDKDCVSCIWIVAPSP